MTEEGHDQDVDRESLLSDGALPTRREVVRKGAKLAFLVPAISTFFAGQALAYNMSCYAQGDACDVPSDWEPCCPGLTCQNIVGNTGDCQP